MGQPNFWDNPEKAQQIIQQLKPLNGLLKPFEELAAAAEDLQALAELADEDAEPRSRAGAASSARLEKQLDDFELRAMLSGPQDASNAYLPIQAGTGGTEACDWAQMLMRMYTRWAERHGYQVEMVDELRNEEAGIRSATLHIIGDYAYGYLQSEAGVHRLVRISPFDSNARRQTSFAAVDVTAGDRRDDQHRDQARRPASATRSAAAAPAASTRTRPSRACATRTCRPASPPRAAPSAASTRTTPTP